jgi:hypothetical protein
MAGCFGHDVDDRLRVKYSDVDMERKIKIATDAATKRIRDDILKEQTKQKCLEEEQKKLESGMNLMASAVLDTMRVLDGDATNGDDLCIKVQQILQAHSIQLSIDGEVADECGGNGDCALAAQSLRLFPMV